MSRKEAIALALVLASTAGALYSCCQEPSTFWTLAIVTSCLVLWPSGYVLLASV